MKTDHFARGVVWLDRMPTWFRALLAVALFAPFLFVVLVEGILDIIRLYRDQREDRKTNAASWAFWDKYDRKQEAKRRERR